MNIDFAVIDIDQHKMRSKIEHSRRYRAGAVQSPHSSIDSFQVRLHVLVN